MGRNRCSRCSEIRTHADAKGVRRLSGRTLDGLSVEAVPVLTEAQAIDAAKAALNHSGQFAREPKAKLAVLPHSFFDNGDQAGATLCYQVELLVMEKAAAMGQHQYFIDARNGRVVWHYNSMMTSDGYSLYSGKVGINTKVFPKDIYGNPARYTMTDDTRGKFSAEDANNFEFKYGSGNTFYSFSDVWGNGTITNRQTVGVDAFYGTARSWDYFLNRHAYKGYNGGGIQNDVTVHYGANYENAFTCLGCNLVFGDGDPTKGSGPWVSLDTVGHEYSHQVTDFTAGLVYAHESGALNESFSDIFGSAIEAYATNNGNYLIAEQVTNSGLGIRDMANPPNHNQPDHYENRVYQGACTPIGSDKDPNNDNCGVHTNSGIQNKAFYLLAEGGIHPTSKILVAGIGRFKAEKIFFRTLRSLFPDAKFNDARNEAVQAAADLYGFGGAEWKATTAAWAAVGVGGNSCTFSLNSTQANYSSDETSSYVQFTTPAGCIPAVTSDSFWLTPLTIFLVPEAGTLAKAPFAVASNPNLSARTGHLTIGGKVFTIIQEGCSPVLTPTTSTSYEAQGGTGSIAVAGKCNWTATSQVPWIKILSGWSGSGSGTVTYSVDPNPSADFRSGTLKIGGKTVTISQYKCTLSLSTSSASFTKQGGTAGIQVSTTCGAWTATTQAGWIKIVSGANGSGNGTVSYSVAPNTTEGVAPRTAVISCVPHEELLASNDQVFSAPVI